jgi:hypothetical protein
MIDSPESQSTVWLSVFSRILVRIECLDFSKALNRYIFLKDYVKRRRLQLNFNSLTSIISINPGLLSNTNFLSGLAFKPLILFLGF